MLQQISVSQLQNVSDTCRIQQSRSKRAAAKANRRRERVLRQRRVLFFTALAVALGVVLAFSVLGTSAQATGTDRASASYKYYKEIYVESGDTLWNIAEQYTDGSVSKVSQCINEIRSINGLNKFETLKAGTYIIVPYYSEIHQE